MGLFDLLRRYLDRKSAGDLAMAESFIREHTALYRHYCIPEVCRHVEQFTEVALSDLEAIQIVQAIRDECHMGPIADYNLPGYRDPDDPETWEPESHSGIFQWLFGRERTSRR